jgi:hypothetical protein
MHNFGKSNLTLISLLLALFLPAVASGGWTDASGKPIPDRENMRSAGDFGVQLLLVPDDTEFRRIWESSSSPPTLRTSNRVRRGSSISAMLIFYGCARSNTGKCDVFAEFLLVAPDGKRTPAGSGPVWTAAPVSGKLLLAAASMKVGFDRTDATGNYGAIAIVTDRISGRSLTLSSPFMVE